MNRLPKQPPPPTRYLCAAETIGKNMNRIDTLLRATLLVATSVLILAGCTTPARTSTSDDGLHPTTKLLLHRKAYISRFNGQVVIRLAKPTGIKKTDDALVAKLMFENKGFPNLAEGASIQLYGDPEGFK